MKNAQFKTSYVKKVRERKLAIEFRSGKEFNGWFWLKNKKFARITVPKGKKSIPRGTYKSMANQLKLQVSQFDSLLECPLDLQGYLKIVDPESKKKANEKTEDKSKR